MHTNPEMQVLSSYTLSCDELRLFVEFSLRRGEFGRIGSSPEMEISLPLVGFSEEECRISLDEIGLLWLVREDRDAPIRIDPPSYFHAGPYRFLIREKVEELVLSPPFTAPKPTALLSEKINPCKGLPKRITMATLITAISLVIACLGGVAWFANHRSRTLLDSEKPHQDPLPVRKEKADATETVSATTNPKKEGEPTPDPPKSNDVKAPGDLHVVEKSTSVLPQEPEQMDLVRLAVTVVPCVFLIEVFDVSGSKIGKGTGFSVSADGLVVTNHHVVENGQTYSLVTSQGARFDNAVVVVSDSDTDLALLRIEAKDMPYLKLAESSKVSIGKRVAVYGSPQGLAGSLSEGIISASGRDLTESLPNEPIPNKGSLIQTTAPISPGSSGSPLFDAEAQVIGVMTLSLLRNSQSLNFAVPVEALKPLIDCARSSWSLVRPRPILSGEKPSSTSAKLDAMIEAEPAFRRLRQQISVSNWVEALKIAQFLVDKYPKSSSAHFQHGYCAAMLRLDYQAELSFTKAIELDPLNHPAWNNLGSVLSSQGKLQGALLAFEKAVSLNPDFSQAWDSIVRTNVFLGNWSKATKALDTLAQIDPIKARECASLLVGFRIPDADFRKTLERTIARKGANTPLSGHLKFRVIGVSPDDPLSARSGPGVSFPRVFSIASGAEVFVTGRGRMNGSTEWLPIDYGNLSGWVASNYLQAIE